GGGVKIADSSLSAYKAIDNILDKKLVTIQTGADGKIVNRLLIEETIDIKQEFYVGIVIDRETALPVIMVSTEGGVEIEKVAQETPEKIVTEYALPGYGLQEFQLRNLAFSLGLEGNAFKEGKKLFRNLYNGFLETDASLVEINPLVLTGDNKLVALDAKMTFDDNALYRHPELLKLVDNDEMDPAEVTAAQYNLNYIRLDGNVGCMVNGAGLAMATMDIIKLYGGEPANFLDVGGIASPETVANGFKVLLSDKNVKAVLINIFGGIVRCDRVAMGIIKAMETTSIDVPVVIRLEGTNADEAANILKESKLDFLVATSLQSAAEMAVSAVKKTGV
ncbi:MAG: ADP-forming succinate--CoA ligase subunit beta, partial [Ignavibacteriae bacterium]